MKWISITKASGQEIYELWNADEKLLILGFQPGSGTLRITANNEKRVFNVGREGMLRRRTVLRNEYGVRMVQLNYENGNDNAGTIDFENERLNYSIEGHLVSDLIIYKNGEAIARCELPATGKGEFSNENYDFLILTLCWYLFAIVKKQAAAFA